MFKKHEKSKVMEPVGTVKYRNRFEMKSRKSKMTLCCPVTAESLKKIEYQGLQAAELVKQAHLRKQDYLQALTDAKADAEKFVKSAVKKPADDVVKDFEHSLRYLKTELLLSNRYEVAEKKLNDFVAKINDPFLASKMADEFMEIAPHALSIAPEPAKAKLKLAGMFDRLNNDFVSEEVKEAKETIQYADYAMQK
jgi:hypothetical protein